MENPIISWTNRQNMDNLVTVGDVLSDALGSVWHHVHFDVGTIPWSLVTKDFKDFYYPITCNRVIQSASTARSPNNALRSWEIQAMARETYSKHWFPREMPAFFFHVFVVSQILSWVKLFWYVFFNGKWMVSVSVNLGNIGTWITKHLRLNSGRQPAQCWTGELA